MEEFIKAVKDATEHLIQAEIDDSWSGNGTLEHQVLCELALSEAKSNYELAWQRLEFYAAQNKKS